MSTASETERNEAIEILTMISKDAHHIAAKTDIFEDWAFPAKGITDGCALAITTLRAQSEAERKIEKVREYCKTIKQQMLIDACTLGYQGACREILEILEGAE